MRIAVIGATGTIGAAIADALAASHEVVRVSRNSEIPCDIEQPDSIRNFYRGVGKLDAVVCAAGGGRFKPLAELTDEDFAYSLSSKLMGQVNLVRYGLESGAKSFTLTTGVLATRPTPSCAAISLINAGVEGFVRAAALDLEVQGIRVNAVSPPWVAETLKAMNMDPANGQPAEDVARAYALAVTDNSVNGQIIDSTAMG